MDRKAKWRVSTNGPDWMDLEAAMRAIASLSAGVVGLTILPLGIGASGGLRLVASWAPQLASVDGDEEMVIAESSWPCPEGCTFEGHALAGLYALDAKLAIKETERNKRN